MKSMRLRVGFIQTNPKLFEVEENVRNAERALRKLRADLAVLPELFSTGYNFRNKGEVARVAEEIPEGRTTQKLARIAREKKMCIVAGIAERDGGRFYNSAVAVMPNRVVKYRKIHLFSNEKKYFSAGDLGFRVFEFQKVKIGMMVCFDWFFPESARTLALKGADIIAHPANLVLPFCPEGMRTRALENRVFTITADRVGNERGLRFVGSSQVTGPRGEVMFRAGEKNEESRVVEINPLLARNKEVGGPNDVMKDRKPKFYAR
ncbi:MAG: nitrilase-related carbon-nitrogen hydrolase [Candidatus Micrarchaeota archaeon]